jgi:hypothetical protein
MDRRFDQKAKIGRQYLAALACSIILLTSIFALVSSKNYVAGAEELENTRVVMSESTHDGQVVAASGNNRFIVWQDDTPGNNDIFFKRSTDNGATWKAAVNLSNNAGASVRPQITTLGTKLFVVWSQQNAAGTLDDVYFVRSLDNGVSFGSKIKISASGTSDINWARPQVAASGQFVYITWTDSGALDTFFRRSINSGASFQGIINLSNSGTVDDTGSIVSLAAAGTNVYTAWDDLYDTKDVLFRRSIDNGKTFESVNNLSRGGNGDAGGLELAAIGSFVYAAWNDGAFNNDVQFARSTNGGETWSDKTNLSKNAGNSYNPKIGHSEAFVYVTWSDSGITPNSEVVMKRSTNNGASFQALKTLSTNTGDSSNPQVATSGSNVYFVWQVERPSTIDIFARRSVNNGATLEPVVNISNNPGGSFFPQVTATGANVFIVWQDNTAGNLDILMRRSDNGGSTWKSAQNLSTNPGQSVWVQVNG